MGRRAARNAGSRPPITPMTVANTSPRARIAGVTWKAKATSLQLGVWPDAVVKPFTGRARRLPRAPPARARMTDSVTTESRTLRREKPRAGRVPISGVREATIAYRAFRARLTAAMDIVNVTEP